MTMWNVDENAVDADFQVGTHSFSHSVSVLSFDLCIREALKNFLDALASLDLKLGVSD